MQPETNIQDLFPEPHPFSMEGPQTMHYQRYRRDSYVPSANASTRGRRSIQPNAIVALLIVVLLALAFGITAANANLDQGTKDAIWAKSDPSVDPAKAVADSSTPQSEWKKGSVPMLYQTDPQWANRSYAGATIETHGCGPTCLSMVYIALTGNKDLDPKGMADFSTRCGYLEGEQTRWALMSEGASQLGLDVKEMPADADLIRAALAGGTPMIFSVGEGDFTTDGHFIVVCGIDDSGKLIVHDPNSVQRSMRAWDPYQVLQQTRNIWAYSA